MTDANFEKYKAYLGKGEGSYNGTKLTGNIRNQDAGDPLEEGDTFTIPTNYMEVCGVGNLTDRYGNPVQFLMLDVQSATAAHKIIHFYPNQLAKVFFPYDEANNALPKVKTTGEVTAEYLKFVGEEDGMDKAIKSIAGRKIVVSKDEVLRVKKYDGTEFTTTHKYTYDWAK